RLGLGVRSSVMPVWAAILIGLGSGLLGVLVRIAYERGAEMRSRQIQAADDFLSAAVPFFLDIRDIQLPVLFAREGIITPPGPRAASKSADEAIRDLQLAADELELRLARVQLLFGA